MTINDLMPAHHHCPRCQSLRVEERERSIYCPRCELTFDKKFLRVLRDEDILASEELEGIIDIFKENANDLEDDGDLDAHPWEF